MKYKITIKTNKFLFLDIDGVLNSFDDYNMSGKEFLENINNNTFIVSKNQIDSLVYPQNVCRLRLGR
jgi:histidinol phosphatase-like enzyme